MMQLWTRISHAVLGKMWGGPVLFETKVPAQVFPDHISKADYDCTVRVINNFIELKVNFESLHFHQSSNVRAIARALMQAADVLDIAKSKKVME